MAKAKAVAVKEVTRDYKQLGMAGVNLALAGVSVYLVDYWFGLVSQLDAFSMVLVFAVAVFGIATLFVGKTYYGKGTMNNIKKIIFTISLGAATVGILLYASLEVGLMYPLSGLVLVMIAFYMLSVSANTLNLYGMVAIAMVLGGAIAYSVMKDYITWDTAGTLTQLSLFSILFIGGVWPHFRRFAHGVTGVNKDGGGFGSGDDYNGDDGDGDGDTGDE